MFRPQNTNYLLTLKTSVLDLYCCTIHWNTMTGSTGQTHPKMKTKRICNHV